MGYDMYHRYDKKTIYVIEYDIYTHHCDFD